MPTTRSERAEEVVWIGERCPLSSVGDSAVATIQFTPDVAKETIVRKARLVIVHTSSAGRGATDLLDALDDGDAVVFLALEPGEEPCGAADGCLRCDDDVATFVAAVVADLEGWIVLRSRRRRVAREVASLRDQNEELQSLASRDDLTSLYNLRFFPRVLELEHRRAIRLARPYSLVFLDLDGLRDVNARFGHLAGGRVLRNLGHFLAESIRHTDIAARIGGDEFVIVCSETSKEEALVATERLCVGVQELDLREGEERLAISASFGIATFPEDGEIPEQILDRADLALYEAKARGGGQVCCWGEFEPSPSSDSGSCLDRWRFEPVDGPEADKASGH